MRKKKDVVRFENEGYYAIIVTRKYPECQMNGKHWERRNVGKNPT